jgi:hypothetical protein
MGPRTSRGLLVTRSARLVRDHSDIVRPHGTSSARFSILKRASAASRAVGFVEFKVRDTGYSETVPFIGHLRLQLRVRSVSLFVTRRNTSSQTFVYREV